MWIRVIVFVLFVSVWVDASAGAVSFSRVGSTSKSTNTGSGAHWLRAVISAANWRFVSRSKSGSVAGTWTTDTSTNKTASFNLIHKPGTFSMSISGRAEPFGGGGGGYTYSNFSVSKSVPLSYSISPSPPSNVACGTNSQVINFKENGTVISAYWKAAISGGSASYGATLVTNYYFNSSTPGAYNIWAKRDDAECSTTINNIGVASVSATYGETTITSTTASPGTDQTLCVPKGASAFNVTATRVPAVDWPANFPTWKVNATAAGTAGSATYSFNPATAGMYTVAAYCGSSYYKALKIAAIEVTLTRTSTAICAKPDITTIPAGWGLSSSDFVKTVTVSTNPENYEGKVDLIVNTVTPSQADKGTITKNSNSQWTYASLEEASTNKNPGGTSRVWTVEIKDSFSETTKSIFVKSVFNYLVTSSLTSKQAKAIEYVVWKYSSILSGKSIGTYDASLSAYGQCATTDDTITYGPLCFNHDAENILVSTMLHEHHHSTQSRASRMSASLSRLDYEVNVALGIYPTPPALPSAGSVGKAWAVVELPAHYVEQLNEYQTGIVYNSMYDARVDSWVAFFEFLYDYAY